MVRNKSTKIKTEVITKDGRMITHSCTGRRTGEKFPPQKKIGQNQNSFTTEIELFGKNQVSKNTNNELFEKEKLHDLERPRSVSKNN